MSHVILAPALAAFSFTGLLWGLLAVVLFVVCVFLVIIVLIQDPKGGGLELFHQARERGILHGRLEIKEGVLAADAGRLLTEFFREKRQ